ncbi:hypothetical protein [Burkholderia sp. BCC0397]|uniref:hypothetical protein n=1 Tax=Burkholderia sp. BCC0397 TaxID=486876 RepID=UPI00158D81F7|nr:hypothetical protein [Burkholderia sp. BCC0397]
MTGIAERRFGSDCRSPIAPLRLPFAPCVRTRCIDDPQIRRFFTMRNKSLRYKNSWCRAQISRFAMPKNVPQYKTSQIIICF